jgi:hypothetical protein
MIAKLGDSKNGEEVALAYFSLLSGHFPASTDGNHEKFHDRLIPPKLELIPSEQNSRALPLAALR